MTLPDAERFARLRLARTDQIGPVTFSQLLDRFGSAERALEALPDLVRRGGANGHAVPPVEQIEAELDAGNRAGARLIILGDADYPGMLAAVDPPPPLLWTLGDTGLMARPCIALVGARIASAGGQRIARGLAQQLGEAGHVVVSGLARGIDGAAHTGALPTGKTHAEPCRSEKRTRSLAIGGERGESGRTASRATRMRGSGVALPSAAGTPQQGSGPPAIPGRAAASVDSPADIPGRECHKITT